MSKKREQVCLFFVAFLILVSASIVSAADNDTNLSGFDKSYECLRDKIDEKGTSSMTTEELAFSLMALGSGSDLISALEDKKSSSAECWPSGGCTLRDTAIVMLAYNYINKDTDDIQDWLMNQTGAPTDLSWYLQIDTDNKSKCTIEYDNVSRTITVNDDKTLTGSAGTCFSISSNGYWLLVNSRCYNKDITVSCDADFLVSTFYEKKTGSTVFLTTSTQTAAPNVEVTTKIESICFKQSGVCNYEGSLWSTLAINKEDANIRQKALPYLLASSQDSSTKRYLPSGFLYALTAFDEYLNELSTLQNSKGYWQTSEASKRYYDTAVSLMSLYGRASEQSDKAVEYLLDPAVLGNGCWNNNLRDTAFLLYAANPKAPSGSGISASSKCEDFGYSCMLSPNCEEINGSSLPNFYCSGIGRICCNKSAPAEKTCAEKGGVICSYGDECRDGVFTDASGTTLCCLNGRCIEKSPISEINECEDAGYFCEYQCTAEEETKTLACLDTSMECCSAVLPAAGGTNYWWVWLLIILIILIILAIVFRKQLPMWWFKIKSKFTKKPVEPQSRPLQQRPGMYPPQQPPRPMMPPQGMRRFIPGMPAPRGMPPQQRPAQRPFAREQELDSTLKKLKEMGK